MKNNFKIPAVANHIVQWLKDYAVNSGMDGFVVGISGGVDSAVVSKLCAMTGMRTVCVMMPIAQKENMNARTHVEDLVKNSENLGILNVDVIHYDMTSVFHHEMLTLTSIDSFETTRFPSSHYKGLEQKVDRELELLARANLRARIRMTTLYYIATKHKLLVAGTGNKVEDFGVGFFTKYGDGGVDLSPIADLYKTEVYELAKALGINSNIIDAAPTDGLWDDGRTDETQIGASYFELENAMEYLVGNPPPEDVDTLTDRQREVLAIYTRRHNANLHKMVPIPVCHLRTNPALMNNDTDTQKLVNRLYELRELKNQIVRKQDYEGAAQIRSEEKQLLAQLDKLGIKI